MSVVKELYIQTESLYEFAKQALPKDNDERDQFIAEVDERLAQRDHFINRIDFSKLSEAEKKLGQEILKLNKRLTERLEQIRAEIRANISDIKKKKETGLKYENPYDGPTSDGVFFDKRSV
ncbi:flagellar protein [Halalkalibacter alkaliphilus]|uniref:Flagellar protein FliT n=1 Tax=Halalkalibacter alkaliphilus TaxID=2917993 RepID=A0A9X2CNI2_9BACI|nr:flagellar protein [Halalkalibacter alkaliphilus]MCL7746698.1 flagellar protein [Halalkalibacter alkaliphilus]